MKESRCAELSSEAATACLALFKMDILVEMKEFLSVLFLSRAAVKCPSDGSICEGSSESLTFFFCVTVKVWELGWSGVSDFWVRPWWFLQAFWLKL